jgi:hypothetical protein
MAYKWRITVPSDICIKQKLSSKIIVHLNFWQLIGNCSVFFLLNFKMWVGLTVSRGVRIESII